NAVVIVVGVARALAQLVFFPQLVAILIVPEGPIFAVGMGDLGDEAPARHSGAACVPVVFVSLRRGVTAHIGRERYSLDPIDPARFAVRRSVIGVGGLGRGVNCCLPIGNVGGIGLGNQQPPTIVLKMNIRPAPAGLARQMVRGQKAEIVMGVLKFFVNENVSLRVFVIGANDPKVGVPSVNGLISAFVGNRL